MPASEFFFKCLAKSRIVVDDAQIWQRVEATGSNTHNMWRRRGSRLRHMEMAAGPRCDTRRWRRVEAAVSGARCTQRSRWVGAATCGDCCGSRPRRAVPAVHGEYGGQHGARLPATRMKEQVESFFYFFTVFAPGYSHTGTKDFLIPVSATGTRSRSLQSRIGTPIWVWFCNEDVLNCRCM